MDGALAINFYDANFSSNDNLDMLLHAQGWDGTIGWLSCES